MSFNKIGTRYLRTEMKSYIKHVKRITKYSNLTLCYLVNRNLRHTLSKILIFNPANVMQKTINPNPSLLLDRHNYTELMDRSI